LDRWRKAAKAHFAGGPTEFLTVASPGRYAEPSYLGARSVDLTTDAFIVAYFEKAATLYYLRSGQWQELTLSD
jgi:hypothetical protein